MANQATQENEAKFDAVIEATVDTFAAKVASETVAPLTESEIAEKAALDAICG